MSNSHKTTALFFAVLLFFLSITAEKYSMLLNSKIQNSESEVLSANCSLANPNLFLLHRFGGNFLNSIKNQPHTGLINQTLEFCSTRLAFEIKKQRVNSDYFSYSKTIDRNLKAHDIVYPFHYFW